MPDRPRIPPLAPEDRDERINEVLTSLRPNQEAGDLNIFATLAWHPRLLKRWSAFGGTLLYRGELSDRDRELLILRTAYRCRAEYEWGQHVRIARAAGITDEEIAAVADDGGGGVGGPWTEHEAALLRAADELHDRAAISDDTWKALASSFDERQLIEVCMVVGQYHLVAFTLNSLGVEREPGVPGLPS